MTLCNVVIDLTRPNYTSVSKCTDMYALSVIHVYLR